MNAHRDPSSTPFSPRNRQVENVHEVIVGVLIASLTIGSIPLMHLKDLARSPEPMVPVPSEGTLWTPVVSDSA
jgi:hypothetical protein